MTAPGSGREHVDGLLAVLAAGLAPKRVYDGEAPADAVPPYAVLYVDPGVVSGTLGDRHAEFDVEFVVHGVGTSREQALWVADKARGALLTAVPTVPGRSSAPVWQAGLPPPVQRDDDVQPPLFYAPVPYHLHTSPA